MISNCKTKYNLFICFLVICCIFSTQCSSIQLVSNYDEQIDLGITEFQKQMVNHLIFLEDNIGNPEAEYSRFIEFYRNMKVSLSSLQIRAEAQEKNEETIKQIVLLQENVDSLIELHKMGLQSNGHLEKLTIGHLEKLAIIC